MLKQVDGITWCGSSSKQRVQPYQNRFFLEVAYNYRLFPIFIIMSEKEACFVAARSGRRANTGLHNKATYKSAPKGLFENIRKNVKVKIWRFEKLIYHDRTALMNFYWTGTGVTMTRTWWFGWLTFGASAQPSNASVSKTGFGRLGVFWVMHVGVGLGTAWT